MYLFIGLNMLTCVGVFARRLCIWNRKDTYSSYGLYALEGEYNEKIYCCLRFTEKKGAA